MLIGGLAHAQSSVTDGVLINADNMDRDLEKRVIHLNGHVQVVFSGQHLSCDNAEINLKNQQIVASGHVIMSSERVHVEGDKIVFNYKQNTGHIFNGFVSSGQVVFEGDIIQKVGQDHYLATNAEYTACETCPPGWSFSGKMIDAEIGGYARIRRPVFRVGGVPILILPSLIVPLKSARQSGFLVPSLAFSGRGGAALSESYFWAIDRSRDLTITPKVYEKLGYKLHADYRYVLTENSQGRLQTAWINDHAFPTDSGFEGNFDRWFGWYTHHLEMPSGYVHRADLKGVSDLRYPRDFPDELPGHGDPALDNHISIANASEDQFGSAQVDIYTNLLRKNPLADNEDAVHRAPEIKYSVKEQALFDTGLYASLDANFVNFTRERYNYDDLQQSGLRRVPLPFGERDRIQRDGKYDAATDLFRTGQRLDIRPQINYPFQFFKLFEVVPQVSYRETQYRFFPTEDALNSGFSETAARRYLQTDLTVKTEFTKVYGLDNPEGRRMKHSIEPQIGYSYIPWSRRPNHPFFGEFRGLQYSRQYEPISDNDLNFQSLSGGEPNTGLQFDYEDRTYDKQIFDFGITNRLTRKTFLNGTADYKTVGLFRIWQSYDFNEAKAPTPHPWSSVNTLLDMRFDHFETNSTATYNGYAKVTNISSRVRGMITPKQFLEVGYTRNFILTDEYAVAEDGETRNFWWGAGLTSRYLEAVGQFDYEARDWKLQSFTYALNLRPPGKCWLIKFEHRLVVGGSPDFKGSISFDFGGENKNDLF
jgi:LPS-assembly protein